MCKILFVSFMLAAVTFGQQFDRRKFSFAVDVMPSLTIAAPKPVFNQDWQRFFVPPKRRHDPGWHKPSGQHWRGIKGGSNPALEALVSFRVGEPLKPLQYGVREPTRRLRPRPSAFLGFCFVPSPGILENLQEPIGGAFGFPLSPLEAQLETGWSFR